MIELVISGSSNDFKRILREFQLILKKHNLGRARDTKAELLKDWGKGVKCFHVTVDATEEEASKFLEEVRKIQGVSEKCPIHAS